jgi:hypothetical protein
MSKISNNDGLRDALTLSEIIMTEIEMTSATLTSIALKASRLSRLMGDFEMQKIMLFEAGGYPKTIKGLEKDTWALAIKAKRVYQNEEEGVIKEYASIDSIEQVESQLESYKDSLASAQDASVSISSANPHQFVSPPRGNNTERQSLRSMISDKSKFIAGRRMFIYDYVSTVYHELKFSNISNDIFTRIRHKVDKNIGSIVPESIKKFAAVYENLHSDNTEDWSNAVHSCRRILQDTADVLYPPCSDKNIDVNGKNRTIKLGPDNYINRLMAYVEENASSTRFQEIVGSHLEYLGERLDSIFKAAQKGSHDVISSQDEADRYVIYTYLVVGDILTLKESVESQLERG